MRKKSIQRIGVINCLFLFYTLLDIIYIDWTLILGYYFTHPLNLIVFIVSIVSMVFFLASIYFLFKLGTKRSLVFQLLGITSYLVRVFMLIFMGDFNMLTLMFSSVIITGNLITFSIIMTAQIKLRISEHLNIIERDRLKRIMRVTEKIDLELMREMLEMDKNTFEKKIINYTRKFGMRVQGTNLLINKDELDDFLNSLDEYYRNWDEREKKAE